MPRTYLLSLSCVLALAPLVSCGGEEEPETYDPEEIIATAVDFEDSLVRLDANGILTEHDSNDEMIMAQMWANEIGAEVFRTLDPTDATQTVEMPRGAIFVKEAYNSDGTPREAMQVMAKFEEGYFPMGNDWYFAMITRDGEVIDDIAGKGPEITFCQDCHASMGENTDLIIGLPAEELAP